MRSCLLPDFSRAFLRGSQTWTCVGWGLNRSCNQAVQVPSSKVTYRLPRRPRINWRIVSAFVSRLRLVPGPTPIEEMEAEVDNQVAASAETRTPNWHRARVAQQKSADGRMATEAARLNARNPQGRRKTNLTLTGLLMEGTSPLIKGCLGAYRGPLTISLIGSRVSNTS
jgi:hypothetical protein